jgi:hypothetical protein
MKRPLCPFPLTVLRPFAVALLPLACPLAVCTIYLEFDAVVVAFHARFLPQHHPHPPPSVPAPVFPPHYLPPQ